MRRSFELGGATVTLATVLLGSTACGGSEEEPRKGAMGTIVYTDNAAGKKEGVQAYLDPHDQNKTPNGSYAEGDRLRFVCFTVGRLGTDADVPDSDPVQWSVWYKVDGSHDQKQQWIPQPFAHTDQPLPRCEQADLPLPPTPSPTS